MRKPTTKDLLWFDNYSFNGLILDGLFNIGKTIFIYDTETCSELNSKNNLNASFLFSSKLKSI